MRLFYILLFFLSTKVAGNSQTEDEIPIKIRGLKDWSITKSDSLLIKKLESSIYSLDMALINTIPFILNDCDVSMRTKEEIASLLFIKGEKIDTSLFKVISETLFLTIYYREIVGRLTSKFFVLDQISKKINAVDFCIYVINNNLLNKCAIYSENCTYPQDETANYKQSEYFLSVFADMYKSEGTEKLNSILYETTNNCVFYNLSRIKHYITNN